MPRTSSHANASPAALSTVVNSANTSPDCAIHGGWYIKLRICHAHTVRGDMEKWNGKARSMKQGLTDTETHALRRKWPRGGFLHIKISQPVGV